MIYIKFIIYCGRKSHCLSQSSQRNVHRITQERGKEVQIRSKYICTYTMHSLIWRDSKSTLVYLKLRQTSGKETCITAISVAFPETSVEPSNNVLVVLQRML